MPKDISLFSSSLHSKDVENIIVYNVIIRLGKKSQAYAREKFLKISFMVNKLLPVNMLNCYINDNFLLI